MAVHKDPRLCKIDSIMSRHDSHPPASPAEIDPHGEHGEDAPEGVTVERAAEIEAFLAVLTDEPRDMLLQRFDIDEERWVNARKVWTERIEEEVLRAAAPGLRMSAEEKYQLSMRYSVAYAKAAERAREEDMDRTDTVDPLGTTSALGGHGGLRLGSTHG